MERNIAMSPAIVHSLSLTFSVLLNVVAQDYYSDDNSSSNNNRSSNRGDYRDGTSPTTAILIILICLFFAAGFVSIYLRHCAWCLGFRHLNGSGRPPWRRASTRGVNPDVIATFPTFLYSQVKAQRIGTTPLECAVCLNEFSNDDDTLKLLPGCSHVFHPECIDPWLAHHITCPICRAIIPQHPLQSEPSVHHPLTLPSQTHDDSYDRNHEGQVIVPIIGPQADMTNTNTRKLKRSHSTGHSLREEGDRFTLRLPQEVLRVTYYTDYTNVDALSSALISARIGYQSIRPDKRWCLSASPPFIVPRREEMSRRSLSPKSNGDGYADVMQEHGVPSPIGLFESKKSLLKREATQFDDVGERSSDWLRHYPHG